MDVELLIKHDYCLVLDSYATYEVLGQGFSGAFGAGAHHLPI